MQSNGSVAIVGVLQHIKHIIISISRISYSRVLNNSHPEYVCVYLLEEDNRRSHGFASPYLKQVTEL